VLVIAALVALVVAFAVWLHGAVTSGPPFALSAMHPRVVNLITTSDNADAQPTLDRLAGRGRLNTVLLKKGQQLVIGQLDFTEIAPETADGQMALFVIDRQANSVFPLTFGVGPRNTNVGQGWDSRYQRLPQKYPWLRMLAVQSDDGGFERDPVAVGFPPATAGPITFEAVVGRDRLRVTDPSTQLTFVLAYVGNTHGAWAVRVPLVRAGSTAT
jgi:hypothetical protein